MLAGGRSSEHEISLASARSVVAALDPERYETVVVEIDKAGRWELGSGRSELPESSVETLPVVAHSAPAATLGQVDVVLPILHGPFGEDGTVQGLRELAGVPYVGAGVAASALCMDKDLFKAVLRDRGIPVARNVMLHDGDEPVNNGRFATLLEHNPDDGVSPFKVRYDNDTPGGEYGWWVNAIADPGQAFEVGQWVRWGEVERWHRVGEINENAVAFDQRGYSPGARPSRIRD